MEHKKYSCFAEVELGLTLTACVVHIDVSEPLRISCVESELVSYHGVLVNHWKRLTWCRSMCLRLVIIEYTLSFLS